MALRHFANAPATTLAVSCSSSATSITVTSTTGLPISYPYTLILDRETSSEEVVSVTAGAGATLTVTRGADGTTAFSHAASATVVHGISAQDPREANTHVNAASAVHGITGAVVGTSDTQTVSNKTLGNSNVINGFTAARLAQTDGTGRLVSGTKTIPTGAVVGDTDAQTLTNKTLTSPVINSPSFDAGGLAPVGSVFQWLTATAPTGYLILDGTARSRTTFAALFALWGTTFGAGDGSTTFGTPDFRGRFLIGAGTFAALNTNDGLAEASRTPRHTHTIASQNLNQATDVTLGGAAARLTTPGTHDHGGATGTSASNAIPYGAVNFIVKV